MSTLALTVPEASVTSRLSRSYLYERIKDRSLPTIKVGGRRLVLRSDLEAFLESCRCEGPTSDMREAA